MNRWFGFAVVCAITVAVGLSGSAVAQDKTSKLITVYDRGQELNFITENAKTIGEALAEQGITINERDRVEPSIEEELVASLYHVNIYRARPVVVVDGAMRLKTVSAYQSPQRIADDVGVTIYNEDTVTLRQLTDFVSDGAGLEMTIDRATPFYFDLYGSVTQARTQEATVGKMLTNKGIELGEQGRVSLDLTTPITEGMTVRVWREGRQTVTLKEEIPFTSEIVYDADRPLGYRAVQTAGKVGYKNVTYQMEVKDGVEVYKEEIASIGVENPVRQVEVIGLYNDGSGLTKSRGAQHFVDSKGVSHRETYYDLNMSVVMKSCGQGGYYTVRPDGAKVDAQGYILIAANYARYPKCSIVETSLGPGRVYDTGGFVSHSPDGFDLATDWTRADGI